jgi:hypothetical protein
MRRFASTAVVALALALAGTAMGEEGTGLIQQVDGMQRLVVIDGMSFRVDDATRLADAEGNTLTLQQLPSLEGGSSGDAVAAWYEASDSGFGDVRPLLRLRLTGSVPK